MSEQTIITNHLFDKVKKYNINIFSELASTLTIPDLKNFTALELICLLKKANTVIENIMSEIMYDANMQFTAQYNNKPFYLLNNTCLVDKHTHKYTWIYPKEIEQLAEELKEKRKQAQLNGTAIKQDPKIDIKKNQLFNIVITSVN